MSLLGAGTYCAESGVVEVFWNGSGSWEGWFDRFADAPVCCDCKLCAVEQSDGELRAIWSCDVCEGGSEPLFFQQQEGH